jgi:hypothetical protein
MKQILKKRSSFLLSLYTRLWFNEVNISLKAARRDRLPFWAVGRKLGNRNEIMSERGNETAGICTYLHLEVVQDSVEGRTLMRLQGNLLRVPARSCPQQRAVEKSRNKPLLLSKRLHQISGDTLCKLCVIIPQGVFTEGFM